MYLLVDVLQSTSLSRKRYIDVHWGTAGGGKRVRYIRLVFRIHLLEKRYICVLVGAFCVIEMCV